jgi:hydroxymethylbilane synthase
MEKYTLVTRNSKLALAQSNHIKSILEKRFDLEIEILGITSEGDRNLSDSLMKIGGKGLFVKNLEESLLAGESDFVVHSLKDMPMELPEGLEMIAIPERVSVEDAFVSPKYKTIDDLPKGATVGTSSMRRGGQLLFYRRDLKIKPLRGNLDTRLQKLHDGNFDAIVLASAGLERMGYQHQISSTIPMRISLPAVGQGALAIECNSKSPIAKYLKEINNEEISCCVSAERAFAKVFNAGCQAPIASYARIINGSIAIQGRVIAHDGKRIIQNTLSGNIEQAVELGENLAMDLISKGADILVENSKEFIKNMM